MAEKRNIKAYVADDPRLVNPPEGDPFVSFPVVENKRYKDPETQEWKDAKSTRYEVTVDQPNLAKNLLASLERGQRVAVEGNYVPKPFVDKKTGEQRVGHKIYARDVSASYMHESQGRGGMAPGRSEDISMESNNVQREAPTAGATWGENPDPYPGHSDQFADRGQPVHQQYAPPMPNQAPDAGMNR